MALFNLKKGAPEDPNQKKTEQKEKTPLFGNLFKEDPTKKAAQKSQVFENIIEQKDTTTENKSVLGGLGLKKLKGFSPATALKEEILYKSAKIACGFAIVASLVTYGFFYTQTNPDISLLGATTLDQWSDALERSQAEYSEVTEKQLLVSEYALQRFITLSEKYTAADGSQKTALKKELIETFGDIQKYMRFDDTPTNLQNHYQDQHAPANNYRSKLIAGIAKKIAGLENQIEDEDTSIQLKKDLSLDLSTFKSIEKRLSDSEFTNTILSKNIEEGSFDANVKEIISLIHTFNKSDYSIIAQVNQKKITWKELIQTIERYTRNVDLLYGSKEFGKIFYTSFNLAGDGISISGQLNTRDSKNFSLIANLIDRLEKSKEFKNVEQNSFSKSKDGGTEETTNVSFNSSIVITLELQEGDDPRDEKTSPIPSATPTPEKVQVTP